MGILGTHMSVRTLFPISVYSIPSKNRLADDFRAEIPTLIEHLIMHKQYSSFEEYYVEITEAFYTAESEERAVALEADPKAFFRHVHMRIEEEGARCKAVLPVASWSLVREVTERALWKGRLEWIATQSKSRSLEFLVGVFR
jgi:cullin 4